MEEKEKEKEKLIHFNFAYLSEKKCPHCKSDIEPVIIDEMKLAKFPERPYKRTVKLLGCPICHIIFYKE